MWQEELKEKGPQKAKLSSVFLRFIRGRLGISIIILLFGLAGLMFVIVSVLSIF